jgi:hypothetical protein
LFNNGGSGNANYTLNHMPNDSQIRDGVGGPFLITLFFWNNLALTNLLSLLHAEGLAGNRTRAKYGAALTAQQSTTTKNRIFYRSENYRRSWNDD